MFVGGYAVIVVLTCLLVAMNVRSVVQQFVKDKNVVRLYSYLASLVVMGSLIIGVSSSIVQRVIDIESLVRADDTVAVRYYHRH